MEEKKEVRATDLLKELGFKKQVTAGGPAAILSELDKLGIKPSSTGIHGRGIAFFVSAEDAENVKRSHNQQSAGQVTREELADVVRAISFLHTLAGQDSEYFTKKFKGLK